MYLDSFMSNIFSFINYRGYLICKQKTSLLRNWKDFGKVLNEVKIEI